MMKSLVVYTTALSILAWLNNTSWRSDCDDAISFADYSSWPQTIAYSKPSVSFYLTDQRAEMKSRQHSLLTTSVSLCDVR